MNKNNTETDFYDFNIRYDKEKDKYKTINTDSVLEKKEKLRQFYTGLYFEKCYHNTGRYKWLHRNEEYVYEGKLYANDLHGYGRLTYPDRSSYEGLFFHNKRFGPGVVTYVDRLQDVGLWDGKYLVRLSQNIDLADFYLETVPTIAKTVQGKLFLLKFKEIVPLINENDPVANLAKKLKMREDDCQLLYSKCVRNYKSIFMNRSVYDKNFYTDPKELIVDVVECFDEHEEPVINKITATNLLAWSNEKMCIEMMKHTFMNRKYEKIVSYKIRNAFLPNRRDTFMSEGPIEEMCLKLLAACRNDDTVNISKLISDYDLYPDVSDCFGNTTIIYAALANKRNAIKTLVNLGANVNVNNDECVSALMLCILHYIAINNDILEDDWETSFLRSTGESSVLIDGRMWPTGSSSSSFESELKESSSTKSSVSPTKKKTKKHKKQVKSKIQKDKMINKHYVFNLIYKAPPRETFSRRMIQLRKTLKLSKMNRKTIQCDKRESLNNIIKTIETLIQCGADVNACEVPYPPLISALFSNNVEMVQVLLNSNVQLNKKTRRESGSLNPLHIVCAMDKNDNQEEIMVMLLNYGADANARSHINHWPEARDKLLCGEPLEYGDENLGKTPFHVLAMRYDFEQGNQNRIVHLAQMLVENSANADIQYLGHNALSISALRGNLALMDYLLRNFVSDPNGVLGYNMGVPLTMLTLRRYSKFLMPVSKLESIMETLVKHNANPFNEVSNFDGNAIEFALTCDKQSFFISKENIGLNVLLKISATVLRRYIDSRALRFIYSCHVRQQQNNPMLTNVTKYLNFGKVCNILQILLDNNKILPNFDLCMKVLNYFHFRFGKGKLHINFIDKFELKDKEPVLDGKKKKETPKFTQFEMTKTLVQIKQKRNLYELDFNRDDKDKIVNPYKGSMPEIDENHKKYKVCYECLERVNKNLQLCPHCRLVYFCSVKCNNKKNESGEHPCKKLFYTSSLESVLKLRRKTTRSRRRTRFSSFGSRATVALNDEADADNSSTDESYSDDSDSESTDTSKRRRRKGKKRKKKRRKKRFMKRHRWYKPKSFVALKRGKKICSDSCKGKLIAIGFKEPLEAVEKKMRRKFKPPEMKHLRREVWSNKLKCKFPLNEENIDLMLRVARRVNLQLVPISEPDNLLNPCDPFDYKFWQLFLPYCVFQNGELFYRSNDSDLLYKLPYKHI